MSPDRLISSSQAPPHQIPVLPGRLRERYHLQELLRSSDTTQIWLAVDEKLNRMVTVYLTVSHETSATRLLHAARAAATVPDTRFLQVLDAVEDGGHAYVVAEWVPDATSLAALVAKGPLPSITAVRLVMDIADALASAHDLGQCHIRLDPFTVLATPTRQVKIQGLRLEAALAGLDETDRTRGEAADVQALGALLYAMLTATWPFGSGYGLPPAPLDGGIPRSPDEMNAQVLPELAGLCLQLLAPGQLTGPPIATCRAAHHQLSRLERVGARNQHTAPVDAVARNLETPLHRSAPARHTSQQLILQDVPPTKPRGAKLVPRILAVLLVGAIALLGGRMIGIFGSDDDRGSDSASSTGQADDSDSSVELSIAAASLWDASAGTEHVDEVDNTLVDSDEGWQTSCYVDGPELITKPGTGIIYDLGSVQTVSSASVTIGAPGAVLEMRTAPASLDTLPEIVVGSAPPNFSTVATVTAESTFVDLTTEQPVRTRFVLVWFTALPKQQIDQSHPNPYYDSIIQVRLFR
jgi:hypothetical protein